MDLLLQNNIISTDCYESLKSSLRLDISTSLLLCFVPGPVMGPWLDPRHQHGKQKSPQRTTCFLLHMKHLSRFSLLGLHSSSPVLLRNTQAESRPLRSWLSGQARWPRATVKEEATGRSGGGRTQQGGAWTGHSKSLPPAPGSSHLPHKTIFTRSP